MTVGTIVMLAVGGSRLILKPSRGSYLSNNLISFTDRTVENHHQHRWLSSARMTCSTISYFGASHRTHNELKTDYCWRETNQSIIIELVAWRLLALLIQGKIRGTSSSWWDEQKFKKMCDRIGVRTFIDDLFSFLNIITVFSFEHHQLKVV